MSRSRLTRRSPSANRTIPDESHPERNEDERAEHGRALTLHPGARRRLRVVLDHDRRRRPRPDDRKAGREHRGRLGLSGGVDERARDAIDVTAVDPGLRPLDGVERCDDGDAPSVEDRIVPERPRRNAEADDDDDVHDRPDPTEQQQEHAHRVDGANPKRTRGQRWRVGGHDHRHRSMLPPLREVRSVIPSLLGSRTWATLWADRRW